MEHMQEEHSYSVHMYNTTPPPPRSPTWTQLDTSCSSPSTPKGYYSEWNLAATDAHLNNGGSSTHVWPEYDTKSDQLPCYTTSDILNLPHHYSYSQQPSDYRYFAPGYLLPSPNEHLHSHHHHSHSTSFVLSLPQELSSSSLDTRQRPPVMPMSDLAVAPVIMPQLVTQASNTNTVSQHTSPTSLSPTSPITFPFNGHSPPTPPFYPHSARNKKDSDDEYHPDSETPKRARARTSHKSSSKRRTVSPFPSSSSSSNAAKRESEHKHTCTYAGCALSFARARDLKRHYRLHSGELPYVCEACGKGFIRSDARGRHWRAQAECAEVVMAAMAAAEGRSP